MDKELESNLKRVQTCCLNIVAQIDTLCRENDIEYSLCAGSIIGQYLYQGFIPWDDDIDLAMTRENYNKFINVARTQLKPPLRLITCDLSSDTNVLFAKVIDENTTMVERAIDGSLKIGGIFVDITVFDKIPRNRFIRYYDIAIMKITHISIVGKVVGKVNGRNQIRNILATILKNQKQNLYDYLQRLLERNSKYIQYDYAELFYGLTIMYNKKIFEEYTVVPFESQRFHMVKDFMAYLETRYGRREFYRDDKNAKPPHLIYVSTDVPYKTFDPSVLVVPTREK